MHTSIFFTFTCLCCVKILAPPAVRTFEIRGEWGQPILNIKKLMVLTPSTKKYRSILSFDIYFTKTFASSVVSFRSETSKFWHGHFRNIQSSVIEALNKRINY